MLGAFFPCAEAIVSRSKWALDRRSANSGINRIAFSADLTLPIQKFCSYPFGSVCANLSARRDYTILRNFESIIPAIPAPPPPPVAARICDPVLNFLPFLTGLFGLHHEVAGVSEEIVKCQAKRNIAGKRHTTRYSM